MSNIFFTSDSHFFHKNILKYCPNSRRFSDVLEMNERLIEKWNSQVMNRDIVYHLGDLSFGDAGKTLEVLGRLRGTLHLIKGNHDNLWLDENSGKRFKSVAEYQRIKIGNTKVILFHYPISRWDCQDHGAYHLYGHVHGSFKMSGRSMDIGVDTRDDCGLWSWEEVDSTLKDLPIINHHT